MEEEKSIKLVKKALITNIILMSVCIFLMVVNIIWFKAIQDMLHKGNFEVIVAVLVIPVYFLAALATLVMGIIQVSISLRNLIKLKKWYTIVLFIVSCLFVVEPLLLTAWLLWF